MKMSINREEIAGGFVGGLVVALLWAGGILTGATPSAGWGAGLVVTVFLGVILGICTIHEVV